MKLDLEIEDVDRVIRALDHYDAYLRVVQREDSGLKRVADILRARKKTGTGRPN